MGHIAIIQVLSLWIAHLERYFLGRGKGRRILSFQPRVEQKVLLQPLGRGLKRFVRRRTRPGNGKYKTMRTGSSILAGQGMSGAGKDRKKLMYFSGRGDRSPLLAAALGLNKKFLLKPVALP